MRTRTVIFLLALPRTLMPEWSFTVQSLPSRSTYDMQMMHNGTATLRTNVYVWLA